LSSRARAMPPTLPHHAWPVPRHGRPLATASTPGSPALAGAASPGGALARRPSTLLADAAALADARRRHVPGRSKSHGLHSRVRHRENGQLLSRAVKRRHSAAPIRSTGPSAFLESRTAQPPPGREVTSTQFPSLPERRDFRHARGSLTVFTPDLREQPARLPARQRRRTQVVEIRD
jgi:hypothetical protein